MDAIHRKELKTDKFAEEVVHSVDFLTHHKAQAGKYGVILAAILLLAGGYWLYSNRQAAARSAALSEALKVGDAVISPNPAPPSLNFATQELKDAAAAAAYGKVIDQYKGTQEGAMAAIYLASIRADKGSLDDAAKLYQDVIDSAPANYASLAKLSLAELQGSQGKTAEAEKILRALMDSPTEFVSKEQATLTLGKVLADSNPAEARKLLEPLRESRGAVSKVAIAMLGNMPAAPATAAPAAKN